MNIGIDIDNVIADTYTDLSSFFHNFMGKEHTPFEVVEIMRWRKLLMWRYFARAWRQKVMTTIPLINGAAPVIREWYQKHNISLVTSRTIIFGRQTKKWLKEHDIPYHKLHHAKETTKYTKVKNCQLFIEDNLEEALVLANHCDKVFLFDQPWNRQPVKPNNIIRVSSWQEILKKA
ncbi:hypothetical protein COT42_06210 [Candidatus Saganbacteria bacterium CG08_land_8_20_14_0_20_45_16]|uniref:Nucleotidase n=1 Tax=Candidatus Saganbacteria bacterium CG08_land_8_20_14_0_20_45_16 TaxID=2014293 RepID=A0A2H0XY95_UNCSA|nr:MAG: hypothetical protein COT42_06210 [Candidatus Saganbacteria bacterium CG08_land_8_20_14_0_20_45_16]